MITHEKVDAIIVGGGAGGGVVAKQLATAGFKCVLLERGDWPDYEDSPNDELINQRTHAIRGIHGPDRRKFPNLTYKDGKPSPIPPWIPACNNDIASCVGSGTVTYGAMAWRFMPQDFKLATLYPNVKNSGLADWPISYDELEPFYDQAEYEIGVAGNQKENPFAPPRKRDFPMPAFEYNYEDKTVLEPAMKRLGFHPYPIPMLRNSIRYNGRAACLRNHTCCGYVCPCDAKNGTQNTVIPVAMATGNCEVRVNSLAYEVKMEGKEAKGIYYFDDKKQRHYQPASIVVIAASALETAKLMFMSKSELFPNGLGNNNDLLGRFLCGHVYVGATALFDKDVEREMGPGATIAMSDFNHNSKEKIFARVLCSEFYLLPWAKCDLRPPNSARWGAEHKKFQIENYRRFLRLIGPIQEIPMYENRVVLEPVVKNYFGLPSVKISGIRHPLIREQARIMTDGAEAVLKEAGAKLVWKMGDKPGLKGVTAHQHQSGTCRMGDSPKNSVVDPNCKVWGTENVFIGDGSVHVNNGGFNPVLTIMALAYRTGAHIAKTFTKA